MVDDPGRIDLETAILLLPSVSRAAHLDGPHLHAQHFVELWKVDAGAPAFQQPPHVFQDGLVQSGGMLMANTIVPLTLAFRLLEVEVVERAIFRAATAEDYSSRPCYWDLPSAKALLSELRELVWQAMLAGTLATKAVRGVKGSRHRTVLPAELARLTPDWGLSRLVGDHQDRFVDVQITQVHNLDAVALTLLAPEFAEPAGFTAALPVKPTWRPKLSRADLENWLKDLAEQEYRDAEHRPDRRPSFAVLQTKANNHFKTEVPRDDLRAAINKAAPQLKRSPGQRTVQ